MSDLLASHYTHGMGELTLDIKRWLRVSMYNLARRGIHIGAVRDGDGMIDIGFQADILWSILTAHYDPNDKGGEDTVIMSEDMFGWLTYVFRGSGGEWEMTIGAEKGELQLPPYLCMVTRDLRVPSIH